MSNVDLAFTPAHELAEKVRAKEISPVELVDCFLDRIDVLNPQLNAFLTVIHDDARLAAKRAEAAVLKGDPLPPLHGVPLAVKDLEFTKGIRTTLGSLVYENFVPDEDAIAVERLRRAGAIILGKTNTPEFGLVGQVKNRLGDDGRNPWDLERTPGGSSGGSAAAIAAGLAPLSTGTDSAGSINNPANLCGVYGLKPTLGRVPCWPVRPPLLFKHNGPITRTVRDAALMLQVTAGYDERDPMSLRGVPDLYFDSLMKQSASLAGLRVAWSPDLGFAQVDREVRDTAEKAAWLFESLGAHVEETNLQIGNPFDFFDTISMADTFVEFGELLDESADLLYPDTVSELKIGQAVTAVDYVKAMTELWHFRDRMAGFFENYDILITPANPVTAYPCGAPPKEIGGEPAKPHWSTFAVFRVAWNVTGYPTSTFPCGWSHEGLPIGVLATSGWGREDVLLRAAAAFEKAQPWADRIPEVAKF